MTSKYGSDRNYVLPGDKTRTPVTHEQFLEYMAASLEAAQSSGAGWFL